MTKTPSQLLRETMDAINGIQAAPAPMAAAPVQVRPQDFDLVTTISNPAFDAMNFDDEETPEEIEVGVDYRINGKYYAATFDSPAEYPDLDITRVVDLATGQEVQNFDSDEIERECFAHADREAKASAEDAARDRYEDRMNDWH